MRVRIKDMSIWDLALRAIDPNLSPEQRDMAREECHRLIRQSLLINDIEIRKLYK